MGELFPLNLALSRHKMSELFPLNIASQQMHYNMLALKKKKLSWKQAGDN